MKKRGTGYVYIEDGDSFGPKFLNDPNHDKNYLIEIENLDDKKFDFIFYSEPIYKINRLAKLHLMMYEYSSMEDKDILKKSEQILEDYLKAELYIENDLKSFLEKLLYLIQEAIKLNYTVCFDFEHLE